ELPNGALVPNGFHARFAAFLRETRKPVVAHGVAISLAGGDRVHHARWLARMREDAATFRYLWWTDHLGATRLAGQNVTLPIAVPPRAHVAASMRGTLAAMQTVVPDVGVENSALYFSLGDPVLDETRFLGQVLRAPRTHLLLDLHNLYTNAINLGYDPA